MPPRVPDPPQSMPAYPAGTSRHRPSSSWQQAGTHQAYFSGGSHPYQQQGDWGNAPLAASATEAQLVPQYYGGAPVQTRTGRTYYSGEQFGGQATYDYQNYRDSSTAQPVSSSHPAYAGGPFPSAYPTPDMDMGSGDLTLSYSYSADRTMATNQTRLHPQQSGYTEQYQQGGNDVYRAAASGMVSNTSHQGWLSVSLGTKSFGISADTMYQDPNYLAYHPSLYGQ
ncbi:hypothetical protein PHLCEN_2v10459 [Hermanssonia centrifuga]|uniref:Uncharacterized protein n=1 Tax=Hermanssonia centrifuga TaxID=98765 RepID=A0A2R6NMG3_9APHY|nr:hypothetical protein PHLCEN_2v10459 [Hermanssonia centrifuga]